MQPHSYIFSISKVLIMILLFNNKIVTCSKILALFTTPSRSHFIIHTAVMKELAARGHDITIATTFAPEKERKNYRQLHMQLDESKYNFDSMMFDILNKKDGSNENFLTHLPKVAKVMLNRSNDTINHPIMQKLMKEEQFDLVVLGWFMNDFQLGVAGHFKCPSVIIWSAAPMKLITDYVGNPSDVSSYVPHLLLKYPLPMTFFQRVKNFIGSIVEQIIICIYNYIQNQYYISNFPPDKFPNFDEVKRNVSLVLTNYHFSQGAVRPLVPTVIEVGGMQIKTKPDPLPNDIQTFMDGSSDGVIFFSLGSNIKSSQLPNEKRTLILNVLRRLKQKVIWKWEDENLPGKPDNVFIGKWLPQDDILAHPNTRLFISHCGLGSVVESKYHGVPILGLPLFGDQISNCQNLVDEGWGINLLYSELTENVMYESITNLLGDPKYKQKVKLLSRMYRDRPQSALDTAVYWIEYILRYDGAKHMQSGAVYLNFIQYHSIDVMLFILFALYIIYKIMKCVVISICCRHTKKKRYDKYKNE